MKIKVTDNRNTFSLLELLGEDEYKDLFADYNAENVINTIKEKTEVNKHEGEK